MGKVLPSLTDGLKGFIERQQLFFVATAPLAGGHVNLSPKGMDSFRVLGPATVAYLDNVGSGNETAAHVLENGRITFMFCAFEGSPLILRLYGTGRSVLPGDAEWSTLAAGFPSRPGIRQIIVAELTRVQSSCGHGVPFYTYTGEREQLVEWAATEGPDKLAAYQLEKNVRSIDGLPTPLLGTAP
jgi:Pyridoxamine 5'-phosphate oxidase